MKLCVEQFILRLADLFKNFKYPAIKRHEHLQNSIRFASKIFAPKLLRNL